MSSPRAGSAGARVGGKRHALTLLSADLSHSTRLSASLDAERFAGLLAQVHRTYRAVVARHGGTVARIQGDGLLAIFGYPEGDGGNRGLAALDTAFSLQAEVSRLRLDAGLALGHHLDLHSGIHVGTVLVRRGDAQRGQLDLIGETANIVARLCDAARSGEVMISDSALNQRPEPIDCANKEWLTPRGCDMPMVVWRFRPNGRDMLDAKA